jgi:acyl-CoA-binding protein
MSGPSPQEVREYLAGLEQADAFEVEELRRTPVEVKLRQIWSLMGSADLLENEAERDAGVTEMRERWRRIHQAFP